METKKHRGNLYTDARVSRAPGIDRVTLSYDEDTMMCYFYLDEGSKLEMHTHVQSQSGIVIKGHIHFLKEGGEVLDLKAGDAYYFASNEMHGSIILEDTELIECFTPSRDDYKD
ncbi:cupin domain-containing protein [Sphaerochaeta sp.]|jgi:quercetin dioxygenase-like cupin family protein|uniref:cupin domain-containing protein n=1 Tax=Sphaerochaeta sp. TaxID=1972642 RepID=UPI002FC725FE